MCCPESEVPGLWNPDCNPSPHAHVPLSRCALASSRPMSVLLELPLRKRNPAAIPMRKHRPNRTTQHTHTHAPVRTTRNGKTSRGRSGAATAAGPPPRVASQHARKPQKNVAADKTRFAPARIHDPRHAQAPPSSPPGAQQCWLRCLSSSGDPAPTPAAAKACAAAPSSPPSRREFPVHLAQNDFLDFCQVFSKTLSEFRIFVARKGKKKF